MIGAAGLLVLVQLQIHCMGGHGSVLWGGDRGAAQAGLAPASETGPERRYEFAAVHMGTTCRVTLYAASAERARQAADAALARIGFLDDVMSDYKPHSELNRLCRAFDGPNRLPVRVSTDLFVVLEEAERVSRRSEGAFDVTVGPLSILWRHARRTQELPDPQEFAAARRKVGYEKVRLEGRLQTVQLAVGGMQLDLGGIAKGYAADAALAVLREQFGIRRALVAVGGDIACGEPPPGERAWRVQIAPLRRNQPPRWLRLANAAVSTSGDLEQFVVIKGVRYSHVLDPRTGMGLTGRRSVTVIAPRGIQADSLTKAVSVLPPEKGLALVEEIAGAAAYIAVLEEDGRLIERSSRRFAEYLEQP